LARTGAWQRALDDCDHLLRADAADPEVWFQRGRAHARLGQLDRALHDWHRALELNPADGAAWLGESLVHAFRGENDQAADAYAHAAEFSRAVHLHPERLWEDRHLAALEIDPEHWEDLWADVAAAGQGRTNDAGLWRARGLAAAARGQWRSAATAFTRATELTPGDEQSWRGLGRAHAELGEWDAAASALTEAGAQAPDDWHDWYLRGVARQQQRLDDLAAADFDRAVDRGLVSWRLFDRRGQSRMVRAQYEGAVADFSRALELHPDEPLLWQRRGYARVRLRQWAGAAADLGRAIERGSVSDVVWRQRVLLQLAAGDVSAARRGCAVLVEQFGATEDPVLLNRLAWVCAMVPEAGVDPAVLVGLSERAVAKRPRYRSYLNTLGGALYRAGRYADAATKLEDALRLKQGNDGLDWVLLALARQRQGQTAAAQEALCRARHWYETAVVRPDPGDKPVEWFTRLEFELLQAEAERLLGIAPP
jgi:tetratricopeptide (TPR) repeat protein